MLNAVSSSVRQPWSALLLKGLAAGALIFSLSGCVPIPIIEYSPSEPATGETVTFDGTGTIIATVPDDNEAVSYSWTYGDGSTGSGSSPTHTYDNAGTYEVTLKVIDSAGRVGESMETITVSEATATTSISTTDTVSETTESDTVDEETE